MCILDIVSAMTFDSGHFSVLRGLSNESKYKQHSTGQGGVRRICNRSPWTIAHRGKKYIAWRPGRKCTRLGCSHIWWYVNHAILNCSLGFGQGRRCFQKIKSSACVLSWAFIRNRILFLRVQICAKPRGFALYMCENARKTAFACSLHRVGAFSEPVPPQKSDS